MTPPMNAEKPRTGRRRPIVRELDAISYAEPEVTRRRVISAFDLLVSRTCRLTPLCKPGVG